MNIEVAEDAIRSLAVRTINNVQNRKDHPTFGYTKTKIRAEYEQMEGAIGLYMVLTDQARHAGMPSMATFVNDETTTLVTHARSSANSI